MPLDDYDRTLWVRGMKRLRRARAKTMGERRRLAVKEHRYYKPRPPNGWQNSFVGVDGEGGGEDAEGRQFYKLLRAGEHCLFDRGRPLTTIDCLEFLLDLPPARIYVGFSFGYDATQILRDLPPSYLDKLFRRPEIGNAYCYWRRYAIDYLPGHYLRVARLEDVWTAQEDGSTVLGSRPIPGTARTVYETFGFFQCSFTAALTIWNIGDPAVVAEIAAMKEQRGGFDRMTPAVIDYNRIECEYLAKLMKKFRAACHDAGLQPRSWNGAGKLASWLLRNHLVTTGDRAAQLVPPDLAQAARLAFYGGRIELFRPGAHPSCCESDKRSAYPAAMLDLPCLEHGAWEPVDGERLGRLSETTLYIADVNFSHPAGQLVCGLPWRSTDGYLSWPRYGRGTYWSPELRAAQRLGTKIHHRAGWLYERRCDCQPFGFIRGAYAERQSLESLGKGLGIPIKLGINALYGKLSQRQGRPKYRNPIWAGLITAITRARMIDAVIAVGERNTIAIATDAIFTATAPQLDVGDDLGQWELKPHGPMMFCRPGIYWEIETDGAAGRLLKTRGMTRKRVNPNTARFEALWADWCRRLLADPGLAPLPYPAMTLQIGGFLGLKLAWARGKPASAGKWLECAKHKADPNTPPCDLPCALEPSCGTDYRLSSDWQDKRQGRSIVAIDAGPADRPELMNVQTLPIEGGLGRLTTAWASDDASPSGVQEAKLWADGQRDQTDMLAAALSLTQTDGD